MKQGEIKKFDNEELVTSFYWLAIRSTHEVNSRRGITQQTIKEEEWILEELCSRFGLEKTKVKEKIDR